MLETKPTKVRAGGKFNLRFANFDDRLTLWVDGATPFGDGVTYETDPEKHAAPTAEDLNPASIGVQGAGNVEVSQRVADVCLGALSRALPGRIGAGALSCVKAVSHGKPRDSGMAKRRG